MRHCQKFDIIEANNKSNHYPDIVLETITYSFEVEHS